MRNSAIDKRKTVVSVKLNGRMKSDEFSDVSEQGSIEQTQENEESVDEQIGWSYFHQSKLQIESLVKEIIPKYKQYRNILYESIRQICLQGNLTKYDYSRLAKEPEAEPAQPIVKPQIVSLDDKVNMVQKIISERRIKKYYKNKHEINFQDELDPQDDERQIYRLYQQAFFKKEEGTPKQPKRTQKQSQMVIYNQQYLTVPQSGSNINNSKISQIGNKVLDLSNQYNVDINDESFERMKYQNQNLSNIVKKVNYTKINDPFVGFQHQLSFDVKNQQYFVNNNENHQIDSFGFMEEDRDEINSEIRYDAEKLKKFNKVKNNEKSGDQLSHTDNIFKNYVDKQHEELSKQKLRVEELAQKAEKVLNNDLEYQETKPQNANSQQDKIAQFRYLLGEIIQIYSVKECLKYTLKFKSYELLNKLYQNASDYFGEEILFQEPLQVKYLSQIIKAALPQQQEDGIRIVVHNIFGNAQSITYEQFLERLTPSINDKEYDALQSVSYTTSSNKSFDLTVRLFNIWIQIDYFEKQLKALLQNSQEIVDKFIEETTQNAMLMPHLIAEFISKSKKFPKNRKVKSQIFFRKILGPKLMLSEFYRWIDTKSQKVNQKFKKQQQQEKYQFYYHLY